MKALALAGILVAVVQAPASAGEGGGDAFAQHLSGIGGTFAVCAGVPQPLARPADRTHAANALPRPDHDRMTVGLQKLNSLPPGQVRSRNTGG